MNALLLLGCFLLAVGSAHMIPEDRLATNRVTVPSAVCHSAGAGPPPVLIEDPQVREEEQESEEDKEEQVCEEAASASAQLRRSGGKL